MSLDLGNEWIKIAIVSPGKPMEIILNSDSSRKTPLSVAFRDGQRFFGEAALTTNLRFPDKAYDYLLDLIGKPLDDPIVQKYIERFPYRKISTNVSTLEDGTSVSNLQLNHPDGLIFTPEELLAMVIEKSISYTEHAAGDAAKKISEGVITIPPYFTPEEIKSVKTAASLAGLRVLELLNSNTAVAVNFGIFNTGHLKEGQTMNVLFYDMGATSTIATVASYTLNVKGKEKIPTLTMKAYAADRTLGGLEMQIRLRDYLAEKFAEISGIPADTVRSTKRAMSKLMKEAARVKKVLSANTEIFAQVENVMNDKDLRVQVSRIEFEALCSDLLSPSRVFKPITDAIVSSGLTIEDLDQIVLFGGNTRIPKVQEVLSTNLNNKELSKNINTDEAAALGAAYRAAFLSKGFKVKKFRVIDFGQDASEPVSESTEPVANETNESAAASDANASSGAAGEKTDSNETASQGASTEETTEQAAPNETGGAADTTASTAAPSDAVTPAPTPSPYDIDTRSPIYRASKAKLAALKKKDEERFKKDSLLNQIESYITDYRMKLDESEFEGAPEEEKTKILTQCSSVSEWLETESHLASVRDLQEKLRVLRQVANEAFQKIEDILRPPPPEPVVTPAEEVTAATDDVSTVAPALDASGSTETPSPAPPEEVVAPSETPEVVSPVPNTENLAHEDL